MSRPWLAVLAVSLWGHVACTAAAPARGPSLHLMAYNVLFDGADDAKSVKAIGAEGAEVVCLTELTAPFIRTFEASLGKAYPHRAFAPRVGTWGVGFASTLPLGDVQTYAVAPLGLPAMQATVRLGGREVRLVCVHLVPPTGKHHRSDTLFQAMEENAAVRKRQADALVARFAATRSPVVLLGDFNEEPGGGALATLEKAGWARGCELPGSSCAASFPGPALPWPAVFAIDHVYARGLRFTWAKTLRVGGSDHFPVSAELAAP